MGFAGQYRSGSADLIGSVTAGLIAFVVGLIIYEPLSVIEFDFIFFDRISIAALVGDWSTTAKHTFAIVWGLLTAVGYALADDLVDNPAIVVRGILAFALGALGVIALVAAISVVLTFIAIIMLLLALFFGPGDR